MKYLQFQSRLGRLGPCRGAHVGLKRKQITTLPVFFSPFDYGRKKQTLNESRATVSYESGNVKFSLSVITDFVFLIVNSPRKGKS